jgi:hypothetical protein
MWRRVYYFWNEKLNLKFIPGLELTALFKKRREMAFRYVCINICCLNIYFTNIKISYVPASCSFEIGIKMEISRTYILGINSDFQEEQNWKAYHIYEIWSSHGIQKNMLHLSSGLKMEAVCSSRLLVYTTASSHGITTQKTNIDNVTFIKILDTPKWDRHPQLSELKTWNSIFALLAS